MSSNFLLNCDICFNSYLAEYPDKMCPYCFPPEEWQEKNLKERFEEDHIFDRKLRRWIPKNLEEVLMNRFEK